MSVRTVQLFVEAFALLRLVIPWHVCPLLQLVATVRERARIRVFARAIQLPKFANLSLEFHFETLLQHLACLCGRNCARLASRHIADDILIARFLLLLLFERVSL